jgi:DNA adenine methylase
MATRSPLKWVGGKGNMLAFILPELARIPHTRYVEPFGGGASVLANKPPVAVETYNDLDGALYDFFSVLADPRQFRQFLRLVRYLPYSRQFYNEYRASWKLETDRVRRVAQWYYVARQSFGGDFGHSWGSAVTASNRGRAMTTSTWQSALAGLPALHERFSRVQIENADWRVIIERYDTPETLFYCDPPYVMSTRKAGGYAHELSDVDHADLAAALLRIQGRAVLSGFAGHGLYDGLEAAGWQRLDRVTASYAAGRTRHTGIQGEGAATRMQKRVESLWISPAAVEAVEPAARAEACEELPMLAMIAQMQEAAD